MSAHIPGEEVRSLEAPDDIAAVGVDEVLFETSAKVLISVDAVTGTVFRVTLVPDRLTEAFVHDDGLHDPMVLERCRRVMADTVWEPLRRLPDDFVWDS